MSSPTQLKGSQGSKDDHLLNQSTDIEQILLRSQLECEHYKQGYTDLKEQGNSMGRALIDLYIDKVNLEKQLLHAALENDHLKQNNLITSFFQQILILISTILIGLGIAFISINVGLILILLGIFTYTASFVPTILGLLKYLKARKSDQ